MVQCFVDVCNLGVDSMNVPCDNTNKYNNYTENT